MLPKDKNNLNPQAVGDFLNFAKFQLQKFDNPKLEAEMLLAFVLDKNRVWLKTNAGKILTKREVAKFREILGQRKNNIPLAYIIGWKIWNNLKINVSPAVLIPRDETEILMDYIVENSQKNKFGLMPSRTCTGPDLNFSRDFEVKNILDIGTGSGCIAIFCAKNFPKAKITAVDISVGALNVAKKNAKTHNVKINFIESDLLKNIHTSPLFDQRGGLKGCLKIPRHFDIIIANLPYVPENLEISGDVKKEPFLAIFGGKDGLDLIRKLAEQLKSREILFHELWLEFLPQQESQIKEIFAGFSVEFYPDLGGEIYFARILKK